MMLRVAVMILLLLAGCARETPLPAPPPPGALRIASFNVHYIVTFKATGAWSMGDWARRKRPLDAAFKALQADIVGFQEMESFSGGSIPKENLHLDWLLANNPDYAAAASGDPRAFPSTQPILYRRDSFEPRDQGWFFFSETPERLYSRSFNGGYPAFASWAVFEAVESGRRFRVVNIHFDYASRENRRRSALLVAERVRPWIAAGEMVLLIGDINGGLASEPVRILRETGLRFVPVKGTTWHWGRGLHLTGPVDHIAATRGAEPLGDVLVLRRKFAGEWPSDHYPVLADFRLK